MTLLLKNAWFSICCSALLIQLADDVPWAWQAMVQLGYWRSVHNLKRLPGSRTGFCFFLAVADIQKVEPAEGLSLPLCLSSNQMNPFKTLGKPEIPNSGKTFKETIIFLWKIIEWTILLRLMLKLYKVKEILRNTGLKWWCEM